MKLVIGEQKYDLIDGIQKASLSDLIMLKRATKASDRPNGVTLTTITGFFENLPEGDDTEGGDAEGPGMLETILDSDDGLEILRALIFLCRRRAGETISFEQATDVPVMDLDFEDDEEAEVADESPKDEPAADEALTTAS